MLDNQTLLHVAPPLPPIRASWGDPCTRLRSGPAHPGASPSHVFPSKATRFPGLPPHSRPAVCPHSRSPVSLAAAIHAARRNDRRWEKQGNEGSLRAAFGESPDLERRKERWQGGSRFSWSKDFCAVLLTESVHLWPPDSFLSHYYSCCTRRMAILGPTHSATQRRK